MQMDVNSPKFFRQTSYSANSPNSFTTKVFYYTVTYADQTVMTVVTLQSVCMAYLVAILIYWFGWFCTDYQIKCMAFMLQPCQFKYHK